MTEATSSDSLVTPPTPELGEQITKLTRLMREEGGSLGLSYTIGGYWVAGFEWGQEAPNSPMAAAASYGMGDSAEVALQHVLEEIGIDK